MAEFNRGKISELKRKELGLSREEVACGICDTSTLLRYEKGVTDISREKFRLIQERLGQPITQYIFPQGLALFIDYKDYESYEELLRQKNLKQLVDKVSEIEKLLDVSDGVEKKQFIGRIKLFEYRNDYSYYIEGLEALLKESVQEYHDGFFPQNRIYNYTELSILISIASAYGNANDRSKAIIIYEQLYNYFSTAIIIKEDRIYNKFIIGYSNCLGLNGDYEKSLKLLLEAYDWAMTLNSQEMIYNYFFNMGWLMQNLCKKQEKKEYSILAIKLIEQAITLAEYYNESDKAIAQMKQYYMTEF